MSRQVVGDTTIKMIDISKKEVVYREAQASGEIRLKGRTIELIKNGKAEKGDPIQIAQLAGIQGAKLTSLIMPLCHPLKLENVDIQAEIGNTSIIVRAKVVTTGKTGVEMEALTAVSTALLNIWDVVKMYEKNQEGQYVSTSITNIRVTSKVKRSIETA
jgi:cyclic pyranopterin phosphate synthase